MRIDRLRRRFLGFHTLSLRALLSLSFGGLFSLTLLTLLLIYALGLPGRLYPGAFERAGSERLLELGRLADSRREALNAWMHERLGDLQIFCTDHTVAERAVSLRAAGRLSAERLRQLPAQIALTQHLKRLLRAYGQYEQLMVVDNADGRVLASSRDADVGSFPLPVAGLAQIADAGVVESIQLLSLAGEMQPLLVLSRPIDAESVAPAGVSLVALIRPSHVLTPLLKASAQSIGLSGEILLLTPERAHLASSRTGPVDMGSPADFVDSSHAAQLAVNSQEGAQADVDHRGVAVLSAYRHLRVTPDTGWGLVVKMDREEALAPAVRRITEFLVIGVLVLLLTMALVYGFAARLSRPLRDLAATAACIKAGDFAVRARADGSDEIRQLSRTFNEMVDQLQGWNAALETKVAERSAELAEVRTQAELARQQTDWV